jgi:formylglycine-generating enzyme
MHAGLRLLFFAAATAMAVLSAGADAGVRCAVLPLKGLSGSDEATLRQAIAAELQDGGLLVPLDIRRVDQGFAARSLQAPAGEAQCIADGQWLAVPFVVSGSAETTGSTVRLRLAIHSLYGARPAEPLAVVEPAGSLGALSKRGGMNLGRLGAAVSALRTADPGPAPSVIHLGRGVTLELCRVPAGDFVMGEDGSEADEHAHAVRIARDFCMSRYEITNEQYQRFLDDTGYQGVDQADGDYLKHMRSQVRSAPRGPEYPVVCVSWLNARAFGAWVSMVSGRAARLPTEAEWERACRGGTRTRFYTGDQDADLLRAGWCGQNSEQTLHPVGKLEPNAYGLHDMHGNVWEWCQDWYGQSYYETSPVTDPQGPETGSGRVLRGGSWFLMPRYCRSANRDFRQQQFTNYVIGFRLVVL